MTEYNSGVPCDQQGFLDESMQADFAECVDSTDRLLADGAVGGALFSAVCIVIFLLRRGFKASRRAHLSVVQGGVVARSEPAVFAETVGEQDAD